MSEEKSNMPEQRESALEQRPEWLGSDRKIDYIIPGLKEMIYAGAALRLEHTGKIMDKTIYEAMSLSKSAYAMKFIRFADGLSDNQKHLGISDENLNHICSWLELPAEFFINYSIYNALDEVGGRPNELYMMELMCNDTSAERNIAEFRKALTKWKSGQVPDFFEVNLGRYCEDRHTGALLSIEKQKESPNVIGARGVARVNSSPADQFRIGDDIAVKMNAVPRGWLIVLLEKKIDPHHKTNYVVVQGANELFANEQGECTYSTSMGGPDGRFQLFAIIFDKQSGLVGWGDAEPGEPCPEQLLLSFVKQQLESNANCKAIASQPYDVAPQLAVEVS